MIFLFQEIQRGHADRARESCNDFSLQGRYTYCLFRCMSKTLFGIIGTPMKSESFFSDDSDECSYGCRKKYPKPSSPPSDICVKHKEWREYFPTGSATPQSKYGNCYYHCNIPCILAKCPYFQGKMLKIPPTEAAQLLPVHTDHLVNNMGFSA